VSEVRAGGIRIDISLKLATLQKDVKKATKELDTLKKSFINLGKDIGKILTVPFAGVGAASFAAAKSYSSAFREIQRTTGATGAELKSLGDSFRNVFVKSNKGPDEVAHALTRVAVESKATGKTLEDVTSTIINLSTITNSDLNTTLQVTLDMLDNWGISNEQATNKLNVLYAVSQKTGVAVNDLSDKLKIGGPTLRAYGVGFEEAASMVGVLADKGLDVDKFFASLEKLPKKIADTHDLGVALDSLIAAAGNTDTGNMLSQVIEGFGGRGAIQFTEALKTIRSEYKTTATDVAKSGADINDTMAKTASIGDKFMNLKNIVTDALVPIGNIIATAIKPAIEAIKPYLESFAAYISSINPTTLKWAVAIASVVAAISPLIIALGGVVGGLKNLYIAYAALKAFFFTSKFISLQTVEFFALGVAVFALLKTCREFAPVFVGFLDAAFSSGAQVLLEFELVLAKLGVKIAEWVDAATEKFRNFWRDTALGFAFLKEKLGLAESGSSRQLWEGQQKPSENQSYTTATLEHIADMQSRISEMSSEVANKNNVLTKSMNDFGTSMSDLFSPVTKLISGEKTLGEVIKDATPEVLKSNKATKESKEEADKAALGLSNFNNYLKSTEDDAKKAAEAVDNLREKLADTINESTANQLKDDLSKAIENVDPAAFEKLKGQYLTNVRDGVLLGLKESIDKEGIQGQQIAQQIADQKVFDERRKLEEQFAKNLEEQHKKAYEESIEFWRNTFRNAITGETFNLKDTLKQVAVGFGAELAASMSQGASDGAGLMSQLLKGSKSPQDIGGNLAKYLFGGGGKSGIFSNIDFSSFDSAWNGSEFSPGGIWPEDTVVKTQGLSDALDKLSTDVFAGANTMEAYTSAGIASIGSLKKLTQGTQEAADGITEMAFSAAGAYFGGPIGAQLGHIVGDFVGDWVGGQFAARRDPEAIARLEITGKLEELIDKVGGMQFFDQGGNAQSITDIKLGDSNRFNTAGWAENMFTEFGDNATQAFVGVGTAITSLLGITEDVGAQIGNILIEQFNGDTEALKALVQTAGLTYDQFVEFLVERGKKGQETWLAIIGEVNAGAEAFKEGLTGQGQYVQAFENLLNTAGRGQLALNQLRNIAIEGAEAGVTSLEQLRQMLIESGGFTAKEIDALFAAFNSIGLDSLDKLRGATDLELARIVASMDAFFQDHGSQWSKATGDVQNYENQLNKLNGKKIDISLNFNTNFDKNTQEAIEQGLIDKADINVSKVVKSQLVERKGALGGVLTGPRFVAPGTLAGEAGPEGLLPLKLMSNGRLGVHADFGDGKGFGGTNIYVDARGADNGVEQRLNSLFSTMEDRIMERTVSVILESGQRGGLRGFF